VWVWLVLLKIKEFNTMRVSDDDAMDVAAAIFGIDLFDDDENTVVVEDRMYDSYGMDIEQFAKLLEKLIPMVTVGKSALTGTLYRGLAQDDVFLVKEEIK
jgi:hypothetical protein